MTQIQHENSSLTVTSGLILGKDAAFWDNAIIFSLIVAALAAAAIVIATASANALHKRDADQAGRELTAYKETAAIKIAEARSAGIEAGRSAADAELRAARARIEAAQATTDASTAHVQSAEAYARAAEANSRAEESRRDAANAEYKAARANEESELLAKDAAEARLALEQLRGALAWRLISPKEAKILESKLAANPGVVNLWYAEGDPESLCLATQLYKILENAHWTVLPSGATLGGITFGIVLPDDSGNYATTLRAAFRASSIAFSTEKLSPMQMTIGAVLNKNAPILMVGSRKPEIL